MRMPRAAGVRLGALAGMPKRREIAAFLDAHHGLMPLLPEFVCRFYPDFSRLGQSRLRTGRKRFIPERWICSCTQAENPPPLPGGGLSMLKGMAGVSLADAIASAPELMLGDDLADRHRGRFRVLVKLLDPGEPIVFHLHASDEQVNARPRNFRGHRFGKDEAYFFLDAPKGPQPYTHVGLYEGVTRKSLAAAVALGREAALELSPSFYQKTGTGFFVPASVPHRPGTALTLEIQQPSDVYTLLETHAAGKSMPPQQIHPGFRSLNEAMDLVDIDTSVRVGKLRHNALSPTRAGVHRGGEVDWIFPPRICRKFAGQRIRVHTALTLRYRTPVALWAWKGAGKINDLPLRAGDEYFVPHPTATAGIELTSTSEQPLELYTFWPVA